VSGDLVGLGPPVGVLDFIVETLAEPVTRGVLELETEELAVLEGCADLEGDGWAVGERDNTAECVGV
jgi:hypothetical protein